MLLVNIVNNYKVTTLAAESVAVEQSRASGTAASTVVSKLVGGFVIVGVVTAVITILASPLPEVDDGPLICA